jgi:alpha-galactosidase
LPDIRLTYPGLLGKCFAPTRTRQAYLPLHWCKIQAAPILPNFLAIMIHTLENGALQLTIQPNTSRWSVSSRDWNSTSLEDVQLGVHYRRGRGTYQVLDQWRNASISGPGSIDSPHGPLRQLCISTGVKDDELHCEIVFALPENQPFLFWRLSVENRGDRPIQVERLDLLSVGFIYPTHAGSPGSLQISTKPGKGQGRPGKSPTISAEELAFFSNGWQTWSYTGTYSQDARYHRTRLGPWLAPVNANAGTPRPRHPGLFISDMFAVLADRRQRAGLLVGFLSQKHHFGLIETYLGSLEPALRVWASGDLTRLDPGERMVSDWACLLFLHLDSPDPLGPYLEAVSREHGIGAGASRTIDPPTGWCSWYQFSSSDFTGTITAEDVRKNISAVGQVASRLPLKVIQIDDGFESRVGDWFSFTPGFPDGVSPLAAEIRQAGCDPGLWLAPFIVHPRSKLAKDHPAWILRNFFGRPTNAGYFWNSFTSALDPTHPDALAYARDLVHTAARKWGFSYLKLDFLYAAALPGKHQDPTRTRAQMLRSALETLREAAGAETFLLGCACPLGPAIGLVDAMRIGADTARDWLPVFKGRSLFLKPERRYPSARNATHNAITRAALHGRWWINDPDCLLLRPQTNLSLTEVQTIASVIALTGGSLMLSDHLPDLPSDRLRIAEMMLPLIGKRPHVLDWFERETPAQLQLDLDGPAGRWHLLALFNWQDKPMNLALRTTEYYLDPGKTYHAREFWSGAVFQIPANQSPEEPMVFEDVPPHGVLLMAVRPVRPFRPQYLGGDLHISQGLEVTAWEWERPGQLSLRLERPGFARGHIDLALPDPPKEVLHARQAVQAASIGQDLYRVPVAFERTLDLSLLLER